MRQLIPQSPDQSPRLYGIITVFPSAFPRKNASDDQQQENGWVQFCWRKLEPSTMTQPRVHNHADEQQISAAFRKQKMKNHKAFMQRLCHCLGPKVNNIKFPKDMIRQSRYKLCADPELVHVGVPGVSAVSHMAGVTSDRESGVTNEVVEFLN